MLGLVSLRGRKWTKQEVGTLGSVASLFAQFQARIAAEEKLRYLAEHDELTGLHNRRAVVARLSARLAAGHPGPVAVFYLDLDRLKSINDYYGHAAGDFYLQVFAERLQESMRGLGMIGRIGGDEFLVIPDRAMLTETAESLAHRLQTTLRASLKIGEEVISPSVSIRMAAGRPGRDDTADLSVAPTSRPTASARAQRVAVSTDDISQQRLAQRHRTPSASGHRQRRSAAELLARSRPADRRDPGDRSPGPLAAPDARATATGFVHRCSRIDQSRRRVGPMGHAKRLRRIHRWRSHGMGRDLTLRINVSPRQLVTSSFVRTVADIIDEFGINAESVCLEITERALVGDIETTRRTLAKLKDVGVQIAIDDFGTGYAVLSHLKSLPVDTLKIDAGFVDVDTNASDLAIVALSWYSLRPSACNWSLRALRHLLPG